MKMAKTVLGYLLILSFYLGRFLVPHLRSLLPSLKLSKEKKRKKRKNSTQSYSEIPQGKILHGKNYRPRLVGETMVENIGSNLVETVSSLSRISRIE